MAITRSSAAAATTRKRGGGRKRPRSAARSPHPPPSQPQNVLPLVTEEEVDNLVEGFGKNYQVLLVMEAISKDHDFVHRVRQLADKDPAQRMVCVRTPDLDVTGEALRSLFEQYGEIESLTSKRSTTVSARILFKHRKAVGWRSKLSTYFILVETTPGWIILLNLGF